jgi:hypothetical protein
MFRSRKKGKLMQIREKTERSKLGGPEKVALYTSILIIVAGVIYWSVQIRGVMVMLEMAYG